MREKPTGMSSRVSRRCEVIAPPELGGQQCVMPPGVDSHAKLNAANRGRLGLPVLVHCAQDGRHWTKYGVVVIQRQAPDES